MRVGRTYRVWPQYGNPWPTAARGWGVPAPNVAQRLAHIIQAVPEAFTRAADEAIADGWPPGPAYLLRTRIAERTGPWSVG